jgi:UDP-N-acetylglucosamine--N-acetylmuramyl-(pentapeptide) pyrophosphoryl-undecaprenol N-acetylglucosamine transferase
MKPSSPSPSIGIACGGTGGHLFPGLAVAKQLVLRGATVRLLISPKEVDQQAVQTATDLEIVTLPAIALQRGSRLGFLRGFWRSWRAARKLFRASPPHAVLAMGGFTSAPPILAARNLGAKTFLHESNTIPGRANRWLARFVDQAFVGFPSAVSRLHVREATVTGTPVRAEFRWSETGDDPAHQEARSAKVAECRCALGLDPTKPVVLVMGGSQGASGINEMILAALPILAERAPHWQWLHLTGAVDADKTQERYAALGLKACVRQFLAPMHLALGAATVAVSRAGASSLAELAAMRLPALLVPFPYAADNHQLHNARAFAQTGAAWLLEQKDGVPEKVAGQLMELGEDSVARSRIQASLASWDAPNAADQIAEAILTEIAARVPTSGQRLTSAENQTANSKTPLNPNHEMAAPAGTLGIWSLGLVWCLGFGVQSFLNT